ncbi:alpha/beta hydrolase family protein [Brucella pseudogrignonensis]
MKKFALYVALGATFIFSTSASFAGDIVEYLVFASKKPPFPISEWYNASNIDLRSPPGSVIRLEQIDGPASTSSWRVLYVSQTEDGKHVPASGLIIEPKSAGLSPVVVWAHGTTGTARGCAPSLAPNPVREFTQRGGFERLPISVGIPYLYAWLQRGYVVVAPDYAGLGTEGIHHYLVGVDASRDLLNLVRAARTIDPTRVGSDVALMGASQGGQAVLFAGEIAKQYAPDLRITAIAALAPAATLALSSGEGAASFTSGSPLPYLIASGYSDAYHLDTSIFNEIGKTRLIKAMSECVVEFYMDVTKSKQTGMSGGLMDSTSWSTALMRNNAGTMRSQAPVYIAHGTEDKIIPAESTMTYLERAQASGTKVTVQWIKNAGHGDIIDKARSAVVDWIDAGFSNHDMAGTR